VSVDALYRPKVTSQPVTPAQLAIMTAIGTIVAVSTIGAAIGILAGSVVVAHTVETTSTRALQGVLEVAAAGTLAQISLLSFIFTWEKCRQWRSGAEHCE